MVGPTEAPAERLAGKVADGWTELARGRWESARAAFQRALRTRESPAALEGLSWAAWWLDDAEVLFEARQRAYLLYRRTGDVAAAARMATWLATDHFDFNGALAVANGWIRRAHRLLDPLPPGPDHGWLLFLEGFLALASGALATAETHARGAAELGRRFEVADLQMLGLALEGATLVARTRVPEGMCRLDEAAAAAMENEAAIPIANAWTCCFLVSACIAVRDYERALQWCDRIAEFAERYSSRYMLAFCRTEYAAVHLWQGRWREAENLLTASIIDFSRSRPASTGGPRVGLAELRQRQGSGEEATRLLDQAGPSARAQLCRARLALDRAETGRAAELAERVLRQLPAHATLDRAPALELLARARIVRGELAPARTAIAALEEIARLAGTPPLRAAADLYEGMYRAAAGDHDRARPLLEDAVDRFEQSGGRFEAAEARTELAITLAALGRAGAGRQEARAALEALSGLGAATAAARARRILEACERTPTTPTPALTRREQDVLRLLVEGLTNRQTAERLVVSEHTVHRHVTNILRKLDLPSRTAAAAYALRSGVLDAAVDQRPFRQ